MTHSTVFTPPLLFFILGFCIRLIRGQLELPGAIVKGLSIYLVMAIGIHGGIELGNASLGLSVQSILVAIALGIVLPLVAYCILHWLVNIDKLNSVAIAAHYGSVSIGTFLTTIAFLNIKGYTFTSYPLIMLVIMESPAIFVGLLLSQWIRNHDHDLQTSRKQQMLTALKHAFTNGTVLLLLGCLLIGYIIDPDSIRSLRPFYENIFQGVLTLYILAMGLEAGSCLKTFKAIRGKLGLFGLCMPIIGGTIGLLLSHSVLRFDIGSSILVSVLGASASYIAVPPAMRLGIPEANPSLSMTLALGVTFPFNVIVGIPLYTRMAEWLYS